MNVVRVCRSVGGAVFGRKWPDMVGLGRKRGTKGRGVRRIGMVCFSIAGGCATMAHWLKKKKIERGEEWCAAARLAGRRRQGSGCCGGVSAIDWT
ncbi:hypothetical protein HAX54_015410 [Datura stramonium]|uniref:Uncharacterized protein n=1 Tax=Datura stramonium TaxID=4076 RepID=A0ABS8TRH1_DATST|nr:hypothetical protein [Datura stramonium]